jgi:hypothetical protein
MVTVYEFQKFQRMEWHFRTECDDGSSHETILYSSDERYILEKRTSETKRFNQQEIKHLIRALSLSKDKAEVLASRLKERNLVLTSVTVCHYRIKNKALKIFFRLAGPIVFCHDINRLFKGLKQEHPPPDLRLFIYSSQRILKSFLLHNATPNVSFRLLTLYT